MTAKMRPYVVRQGDYLTKLAFRMAFSASEVWDHPKNAELKVLRKEMDVLLPGDLLYIPEPTRELAPIALQAANRFQVEVPKVTLKLSFSRAGEPLAGEAYEVVGLPSEVRGTSGGDGSVTIDVPVNVRQAQIVFAECGASFPIHVGDLDPSDELSGARMRLANLGYYRDLGVSVPENDDSEEAARLDARAVRAFQQASALGVTGELDAATKAALRDAHGS